MSALASIPTTPLTWVHQVDRHSFQMPELSAIRYDGKTTTWRQLADRSSQIAHALAKLGVGLGDRVGLLLTNRKEYVETVVGINRLGAIAVPINFRLQPAEIRYVLDDAGIDVLISESAFNLVVSGDAAIEATGRVITHIVIDATGLHFDFEQWFSDESVVPVEWPATFDSVALIMYTSGTTGFPKGAMLSYANLAAASGPLVVAFGMVHADEVFLVTSPMFHIAAIGATLPFLIYGFTVAIAPTGQFSAERFLDLAESEQATACFLVPTQWQEVCASPTVANRTLALRTLGWGAAPATPALLRQLNEVFPGRSIISCFGQTETSPNTTILRGEDAVRKLGSVGRPLPITEVRVVDAAMNDVPPGEVGEIVYRGPHVMQGYWNKPEETAKAFAGGWFHSGDLVTVDDDGFFYVVDRLKDMIISGGENIYCAEVEAVIADHPLVREIALVGRPHERWGETPVAVIVPHDASHAPTAHDIIDFCRPHLASYKKPSDIVIVDALPRNAAGKVLKATLRELVREAM